MSFLDRYAHSFRKLFPSPFILAILLSLLTLILALLNTGGEIQVLAKNWQEGLWNSSLLTFAFQMMFMLVLGHVLALSHPFHTFTQKITSLLKNNAQAVFATCFFTIIVGFINWGLALIFGAILARKIGEQFSSKGKALNYPLVAACGYVGLLVWHGGLSGSSLTKVAEPGHLESLAPNLNLPDQIGYADTVFSGLNITLSLALLVIIPLGMMFIAKKFPTSVPEVQTPHKDSPSEKEEIGVEKLESWSVFNKLIGFVLIALVFWIGYSYSGPFLGFIQPNYINFSLLALAILLHQNFRSFLSALDQAIAGASGILVQFPLYFGILALMQAGGLIEACASFFIAVSNEYTYPIFTFFSAGIVNIFVPSGGGQWAIQGPIILQSATELGSPLPKCILAFAYGDQWTNMLQPFWALPLLSITGLKARDILPYTLILFILGGILFLLSLTLIS